MIVSMYMSEKFIHLYMACGCIKRECEYVCVCEHVPLPMVWSVRKRSKEKSDLC